MSYLNYFLKADKRANEREDNYYSKIKKLHTGLVKVLILSNSRAKKINPRIVRIMFHKIAAMYMDLKHKETLQ